jgi:hypothetical protein
MDHPTQRLLERTNLPESYPDRLRSAVKGLSLPRGVVHARMPDGSFAVFKDAGGKKRLATFLSKHMSPPGRDVTPLVKERLSITKSASIPEDAVVYSAVPDIDSVMLHGLMSSEALAKNQDLLAIARPDLEDRQAWLDKLNKQSRRLSRKGPNVFFTLPDPVKIHDKHYIKKNDLKVLEIALGKLIKDQPNTRIYGMELAPFPKEKVDKFPKRKGIISHKKVKELLGSTPEELWQHYNDLEGRTYAANVPHAAILTENGLIDPKYLKALDKNAGAITQPIKEKLTMKKSANHMVEPSPDGGNYMAVSNLKSLKRNSEDLMCHIDAYTPLPDWVESKLNVAAASIDDVADWFRNGGELNKTAAVPGKVKMYRRALQALKEQSHDFYATRSRRVGGAGKLREILDEGKITPGFNNNQSLPGVSDVYFGKGHPAGPWFRDDTALAIPHKELMKLELPANPALAEMPAFQEMLKKPRITEAGPHTLVHTAPLNPYHWTQVAGDVPVLPGSIAIAPEAELAGLKEVLKKSRSRFISAEQLRAAAEKIPASKFWPSMSKQGSYKTADFADEPLAQRAHDKVVKEYGLTPQDGSEYWRMKTRIYKSMGGTFTGKRAKKASLTLMSVAKDLRKTAGVYDLMLKHSEEGLKPPAGVASAARRGLELRRKASPSNKGGLTASEASKQGIGSGVQRASNLANGDSVSPSTVKRMHSFFSRHEGNSAIDPKHKGKPQNDKGYVSHLLWGGDAGKSWSASQAKKLSEKEAALLGVRNPFAFLSGILNKSGREVTRREMIKSVGQQLGVEGLSRVGANANRGGSLLAQGAALAATPAANVSRRDFFRSLGASGLAAAGASGSRAGAASGLNTGTILNAANSAAGASPHSKLVSALANRGPIGVKELAGTAQHLALSNPTATLRSAIQQFA